MITIISNIQEQTFYSFGVCLTGLNIFKLIFVLFLLILTIYFYFDKPILITQRVKESGFFDRNFKNIILYGSAAATFFSTALAVKTEIVSGKLETIQQELLGKRELLNNSITDLSKVQIEFQAIENKKVAVRMLNYKIDNQFNNLQDSTKTLLEQAIALRDIIDNPELSVTDKISKLRDFKNASIFFDRDLKEFKTLSDNLSLHSTSPSSSENHSISTSSNTTPTEINKDVIKEVDDISKSNIINWDWFETLSSWEKLAISLLLSKSIIFSALLGLIFNFYGDFLLAKFDIEARFPKLAAVIKLRRTFSKYYFLFDCSLILGVIFLEVFFSLYILKISLF